MIYWQLFLSFLQVGLFSIGGGYAAMPLIQSQVVEQHAWLTMNEFTDLITIAEMTPGPIAVNSATFVGIRIAGAPGAVIAHWAAFCRPVSSYLFGIYLLSLQNVSIIQSVLASLRPAVVALIASAGLSILLQVAFQGTAFGWGNLNRVGLLLFAGAFFLLKKFKWNPILVMSLCGAAGLVINLLFV